MTNKTTSKVRIAKRELDDVPSQLGALERMNIGQLTEKYRELYGEPSRSRNKEYLKKRLRWRLEAMVYGGLSDRALEHIEQIGDQLPERWLIRQAPVAALSTAPAPAVEAPLVAQPTNPRDPRVPPPGSVLRRVFEGVAHEVTVCTEGFEYQGQRHKTLSAIATLITGTRWNGFLFFGLKKRSDDAQPATKGNSA